MRSSPAQTEKPRLSGVFVERMMGLETHDLLHGKKDCVDSRCRHSVAGATAERNESALELFRGDTDAPSGTYLGHIENNR